MEDDNNNLSNYSLGELPFEILAIVLTFLDANSLANASRVNQAWKTLCDMDVYWQNSYERRWKVSIIQSIATRSWKQVFKDRMLVEREHHSEEESSEKYVFQLKLLNLLRIGDDLKKRGENRINAATVPIANSFPTTATTLSQVISQAAAMIEASNNNNNSEQNDHIDEGNAKINQPSKTPFTDSLDIETLFQIASEHYASALWLYTTNDASTIDKDTEALFGTIQQSSNSIDSNNNTKTTVPPELYLRYADVLATLARLKEGEKDLVTIQLLFTEAAKYYDKTVSPGFFMNENVLRYSGDCLVDLSRKQTDHHKAINLLKQACGKYEESIKINPSYFMAYYYYGRALHLLANHKSVQKKDSENGFISSIQQFERATVLKGEDFYVLYEHASTLHDYALSQTGKKAQKLFERAARKYEEAHRLMKRDAWVLRNWADTMYDHAKLLYIELEELQDVSRRPLLSNNTFSIGKYTLSNTLNNDNHSTQETTIMTDLENHDHETPCTLEEYQLWLLTRIESLIEEACSKYQLATEINPSYSNAFNSWALALSAHAKITWDELKSESLFLDSCNKFERATATRTDESNIETCNWAMTLVSQASKRSKFLYLKSLGIKMDDLEHLPEIDKRQALNYLSDPQCQELFRAAEEKLAPLLQNNDKWSFFCLARLSAAKGDEISCQNWLLKCWKDGFLKRATKWQLTYFENVKHCEWFRDLLSKSENPHME